MRMQEVSEFHRPITNGPCFLRAAILKLPDHSVLFVIPAVLGAGEGSEGREGCRLGTRGSQWLAAARLFALRGHISASVTAKMGCWEATPGIKNRNRDETRSCPEKHL